jgi:DNA-binding NtrC family response regulator
MFAGKGGAVTFATGSYVSGGIRRPRAPAAIYGPDDDVRLLLRGILLLYRHPVTREAKLPSELGHLPSESRVLIYDVGAAPTGWTDVLAGVIRENPALPVLVLLPSGGEELASEAERAGAQGTLVKPFATHALIAAIDTLLTVPGSA